MKKIVSGFMAAIKVAVVLLVLLVVHVITMAPHWAQPLLAVGLMAVIIALAVRFVPSLKQIIRLGGFALIAGGAISTVGLVLIAPHWAQALMAAAVLALVAVWLIRRLSVAARIVPVVPR